MDSFLAAYVRTALWSSHDESDPETGGDPMDDNYGPDDIAPATLARMESDCNRFRAAAGNLIAAAIETGKVKCGPDFDEHDSAAFHFWLTRNGHGDGFWAGDWPEPYAAQLTTIARSFGEADLYVGDDGLIYQMGAET